jgi:ketosteroid isomerase-like protein
VSQENVDTVSEFLELFAAGDRVAWRRYFAEDVVWDMSRSGLPAAGVYNGHEGLERFFADWLGTWEDYSVEFREVIDAGDEVVVTFRQRGRGRTSGIVTERDFAGVYEIADGIVTTYRQYETRDDALRAAGLLS